MADEAPPSAPDRRLPAVAALAAVIDRGVVLLVRRANPPDAGRWGFPGGKIERGETVLQAAERELHEETGIRADAQAALTPVDALDYGADGELRHHHVLIPVLCRYVSGAAHGASDVLEARWFPVAGLEAAGLAMSYRVCEVAREADALAIRLSRTPDPEA